MTRVFLPPASFQGATLALPPDVLHYLRQVLRLAEGARFVALDGSGAQYIARLTIGEGGAVTAEIIEKLAATPGPAIEVTLYQGLPKGKRLPLIIQKCTELGVARIATMTAARAIVRLPESEVEGKLARWRKIAEEAAEQSLGVRPPRIDFLESFAAARQDWQASGLPGLFLDETLAGESGQGLRQVLAALPEAKGIAVFVGPEGGFAPEEAAGARAAGLQPVSLGAHILRTETAAIVACALVLYEYGELG